MAYAFMAYTLTAYTEMANVVMANMVMAYIVMVYIGMAYTVMANIVMLKLGQASATVRLLVPPTAAVLCHVSSLDESEGTTVQAPSALTEMSCCDKIDVAATKQMDPLFEGKP